MVRGGSDRLLPLWGLLGGLVAGAVLGGLARLWMRLITADAPDFTWSGTLFVVGLFAVTGMLGGLVLGARRRAWRGRRMVALRLLGILPLALLALGPGAVLAPALVLGGLALARSSWHAGVRTALGVLAVANVAAVHVDAAQDWPHSTARLLAASVLCLVVWGGAAAALAQSFTAAPGAALPRTALGLVVVLLLLLVLTVVGLRGPGPLPGALAAVLLLGGLVLVRHWRSRQTAAPPEGTATAAAVPAQAERRREPGRTTGV